MDIKLPLTITDAKTMLTFSTLHKLHHEKLHHQWLAFSGPHSKIARLFHRLSPNSGGAKSKDKFQDF